MERRLNLKPDLPSIKDFKFKHAKLKSSPLKAKLKAQASGEVDLRPFDSPVKDQLATGSCTSQAIASALEYLEIEEMKSPGLECEEFDCQFEPISRLFIYYCERVLQGTVNEDSGASIRDGMDAIGRFGFCRESLWPYDQSKALSRPNQGAYSEGKKHTEKHYHRLEDIADMDDCLNEGYPFVFGITVYRSFMDVKADGLVPMPSPEEETEGGHALACYGRKFIDGKKYYIVKNSYSDSWGDKGYCYIPEEYMANSDLLSDAWTIRKA